MKEEENSSDCVYFEIDGDWAKRQIYFYDGKYYNSLSAYHPGVGMGLTDQPFSSEDFDNGIEISAEEFELHWSLSLRK
ncbi:MAG: hypothetical protein AMXMBFR7_04390 [Planctomycetota bacterium]